jgi:hypothetical protein
MRLIAVFSDKQRENMRMDWVGSAALTSDGHHFSQKVNDDCQLNYRIPTRQSPVYQDGTSGETMPQYRSIRVSLKTTRDPVSSRECGLGNLALNSSDQTASRSEK